MLRIAALTNVGRCRQINEDAYSISGVAPRLAPVLGDRACVTAQAAVLGVYDGCGGAGPGNVASYLAARTVSAAFSELAPTASDETVLRHLVSVVEAAGRAILDLSRSDRACRGMGTTATVAAVLGLRLHVAHVGDTRAYLLRDDDLTRLTRDDTLVNEMLDRGELAPEDVEGFPHQNVLTRALGVTESVQVATLSMRLQPGDLLMLCTDGVTRMVDDGTIASILKRPIELGDLCRLLVDAAERAGGHDNETVLMAALEPRVTEGR